MNIPPKYEDVVAELEVLREGIIAINPESALKQEADYLDQIADLQQRLTVAEQRANRLEELLREERRLHYGDETVQETKSRLFGHFGDGV